MAYELVDKAHMTRHLYRFLQGIEDYSDSANCWVWKAGKTRGNYPRFSYQSKYWYAHRWIYLLSYGELDTGLEIDHLCGNKLCVNPHHLEEVTHAINKRRGGADHRT